MSENHAFTREEVFPSWFANRIQDYLSASQLDLVLSAKSTTVVQVVPDTVLGIAAVNVEGRWRFITGAIERVHPGGAKGTYAIWAVAEDNSVNNTPNPFTDHTNYAFELRITSGAAPTGAGIAITTKIGEVDWSGTAIEALRQTRGSVTGAQIQAAALGASTQIEWTREANGALVPTIKKESIAEDRLVPSLQFQVKGAHVLQSAAVTRKSTLLGAFSTPVIVPIKKILAGQMLEIFLRGNAQATIASEAKVAGGQLAVVPLAGFSGTAPTQWLGAINGETLAANTDVAFIPVATQTAFQEFKKSTIGNAGQGIVGQNAGVLRLIATSEAENTGVELQGACTGTGTITASGVYMAARLWG